MALSFGMALDFRSGERSLDRQIDNYAELCAAGERLGFESVTAGEGYPTGPGTGHVSSPLLVLAALASRTTLRVGTGVTLLPGWHPLKLAYDAAVLDQVSGGRFTLGLGLGNAPLYRRFSVDDTRLADYADDAAAALKALWSGADGYQGTALSISGAVGIRPIQPDGVPLWIGGSVQRSARRAARWGDGWIASSNYPFEVVARQATRYRAALVAEGKDPTSGPVVVNRLVVVAETEAEARDVAARYAGVVLQNYARGGALGEEGRTRVDSPAALFDYFDRSHCIVGTPEQVASRLADYAAAGVTVVQARVSPGDIPLPLALRSVELLGSQVRALLRTM